MQEHGEAVYMDYDSMIQPTSTAQFVEFGGGESNPSALAEEKRAHKRLSLIFVGIGILCVAGIMFGLWRVSKVVHVSDNGKGGISVTKYDFVTLTVPNATDAYYRIVTDVDGGDE